ncbi:PAS domain-containing sensor histidine kinase [Flavivirga jejuensis]|uniref:histidine kinase n=1 Tax=Flavivirga jejuensis TaxID=870487 RepID=A0ABT8WQ50_9FLAO|nr:PAS domain-containing sensor histidine kinase [Flavivirga jejuensis]MDO5975114.1 PAS domain S-box protein [Flavivirga jejuensis]
MSQDKIDVLQRALAREKAARKQAEKILEDKSLELYDAKEKLEQSYLELEASLNKKDSQLQGVFENIVDAYVIMDLLGNILKMNEAAVSLLGFNHAKENFNLIKMAAPEEVQRVLESFNILFKKGSLTDFHLNIITRKNEPKLVHINASIIYDNGTPVAAQGIVRDITLDNKYKNRLETERQKYSNIIANMNLGLVETGIDDKILMVNQSFSKMSGYSEEEIIGKTGKELFITEENAEIIETKDSKRHRGEAHSYEIKVRNKLGEDRYWLVSGAANYNLEGKVVGSIGVHLDITGIRKLEHQKEKLLNDLSKSNEELKEYAHVVSHDLKSPLRSIDALVSWIKEDNKGKLDPTSIQNFELIETTLEKMEQLISDVLSYSSIGSEKNEKTDVDLDKVVKDLIKILYVPDHISINIENTLPTIKGERMKLQQVFQNLIGNAIKFIDKEKGFITIQVKSLRTHYKFSIADNGMGIEKQFHNRIFKIFHALNKSKDSTGIGLSIVKKIIDLHEGEIWLESNPGEGTTFFFTLKK